jgi:cytochrome b561
VSKELRNTRDRWGLVSRGLHWAVLALVVVQIPLGFWMVEVYEHYTETYAADRLPLVLQTSMIHHTIGFLVLILATFRLSWRFANPTPGLPASLAAYQRFLARLTHVFLYLLLFLFPLTGWASLSAYEGEFPIFFFGWDSVPRIVPQVAEGSTFAYEFFADIHKALWKIGAGILGLHVSAALWHQFLRRDGLLLRMWRGGAPANPEEYTP